MSEVQPQPGDKVRAVPTYAPSVLEGKFVRHVGDTGRAFVVDDDDQYTEFSLDDYDIEIVERADDPSRDERGQWRASPEHVNLWRKIGANQWISTGTGIVYDDEHVRRYGGPRVEITVNRPGTPAAQAQQPDTSTKRRCAWWHDTKQRPAWNHEDSDYCPKHTDERVIAFGTEEARWAHYEGNSEPLVVEYGDPEPDRSLKFTTCLGKRLHRASSGLNWSGPILIWEYQWDRLPADWFPLTQVVEP